MPKPELFLYVVHVDNLRLRDKPNQASNVVTQLKEGALVEGAGNESTNQEEIELRGISYRAPYIQVTALSSDKASGWAFGGALTCVYAGSRADCPDTERIAAFSEFLKTLDAKELASGGKAWGYVEENLSDATPTLADAAFVLLERFMRRMEAEGEFYKLTEPVQFSEMDAKDVYNTRFDYTKYPQTRYLPANGFRLAWAEGTIFPVVSWTRLQDFFGPRSSHAMQRYINQRTAEHNNPMYSDGGISIPLEYVADVAVFWEKFNRDYPYFPYSAEAKESETWLRLVLVSGADNTPVFSNETDSVSEEFKSVWDYIAQKHPSTQLAKHTKQMAELCASEGWKRTDRVDAFLNQMAK